MPEELIRFEDFELDRGAFELRRKGRTVRLERIPLELLFLLVERQGLLVGREEILERIWGKDVFVDTDNSINTAVRKIRQALGDNPEEPRFLQTVPGKGYRFAARVIAAEPALVTSGGTPEPQSASPSSKQSARKLAVSLASAVILIIATAAAVLLLRHSNKANSARAMLVVLPFVNLSGDPQQEYFADGMTEK